MKVQQLLVYVGSFSLILERDESVAPGMVRVNDPIEFMKLLEAGESDAAPPPKPSGVRATQETYVQPAAYTHKNGPRKGHPASKAARDAQAKRKKVKKNSRQQEREKHFVSGPEGAGIHGPRLGTLHITPEDFEKLRIAVLSKDGALSPMERTVLRQRLGINTEPQTVQQIAEHMHLKYNSAVSVICIGAMKKLGIRRRKRRNYGRAANQSQVEAQGEVLYQGDTNGTGGD